MNILVGTNRRVKILEVTELAIKLILKRKRGTVNANGMNIVKRRHKARKDKEE